MRYFLEHDISVDRDAIWLYDETLGLTATMWLDSVSIKQHPNRYENLNFWFKAPILNLRDEHGVTFYHGLSQGNIKEITFEQLLEL